MKTEYEVLRETVQLEMYKWTTRKECWTVEKLVRGPRISRRST